MVRANSSIRPVLMQQSADMGNEVSSAEDGQEAGERESDGWTSREEAEVSGGLWRLSHELEDDQEVCLFTCTASSVSQTQLCQSGAEHLRLLRHPSILKFLSYDISESPLVVVTEPVVPVRSVMGGMCEEGMVTGWRDIAEGLLFLHDKANISHNSLCSECVFVCANTSHWKIGGFEAAALSAKISHTFIEMIAAIRPPDTIPPEDKSPSAESAPNVPCHSRDVWAFAQFMLSVAEEAGLSGGISDVMYSYMQQEMLNSDPKLRPTVQQVMAQSWMRNDVSEIADFLSQMTVKTQAQRDLFFSSLPARLHALPPRVVAEHLLPLILTPLVMTEKVARRCLWQHILTPVSSENPRRMNFDPSRTCPLFDEDLFIYHAAPLLLNLMESHDYHVRMVLLEHLLHFAPLCPREELTTSLLPEVLVGLRDVSDEMVQATLRALADLVGLVGGEVVMGTSRSAIFADSAPRRRENPPVEKEAVAPPLSDMTPPTSTLSEAHPITQAPPTSQEEVRRQRAEVMRAKREEQRRKRMKAAGTAKLGVASSAAEEAESEELTTPTGHAQYSPSVSHDEDDRITAEAVRVEELEEEEEEDEEEDEEEEESGAEKDSGSDRDWEGFGKGQWDGGGWAISGTSESNPLLREKEGEGKPPREMRGAMKLGGGRVGKRQEEGEGREAAGVRGRDRGRDSSWSKATLSEKDRQRLEEQAAWSMEPDFFADMAPSVAKTTSPTVAKTTSPGIQSRESATTATKLSSLQYHPQPAENEEGDGWDTWSDGDN